MSIVSKRNASPKAYITANARDNQYILAELTLTDQLLSQLSAHVSRRGSINYYACKKRQLTLIYDKLLTLIYDK